MGSRNTEKKKSIVGIIIGTLIISVTLCIGVGYILISKNIIKIDKAKVENAYIDAGTFNIQLKDTDRKRYFQGRVYVGYDKGNSDYEKELTKNKQIAVASEAINSYLSNQNYDYLNDVNNISEIKSSLLGEVNKELQTCKITDIRFYSYLLQ